MTKQQVDEKSTAADREAGQSAPYSPGDVVVNSDHPDVQFTCESMLTRTHFRTEDGYRLEVRAFHDGTGQLHVILDELWSTVADSPEAAIRWAARKVSALRKG